VKAAQAGVMAEGILAAAIALVGALASLGDTYGKIGLALLDVATPEQKELILSWALEDMADVRAARKAVREMFKL